MLGLGREVNVPVSRQGGANECPKRDAGRCYLRAGFKNCGMTKGGLVALQLLPADMPQPVRAIDDNGGQALLFEYAASIYGLVSGPHRR